MMMLLAAILRSQLPVKLSQRPQNLFVSKCFYTVSCNQKKISNVPLTRTCTNYGKLFTISDKKNEKFKRRDGISKEYSLIYNPPMEWYIRPCYLIVLVIALVAPPFFVYCKEKGLYEKKQKVDSLAFTNPLYEAMFFTVLIVGMLVVYCGVAFKYPFRIYKHNDKKEYIAMFLSANPFKLRQIHFNDATPASFKSPLYSFMANSQYYLNKKKKTFLMNHYFRTPADLFEMQGEC